MLCRLYMRVFLVHLGVVESICIRRGCRVKMHQQHHRSISLFSLNRFPRTTHAISFFFNLQAFCSFPLPDYTSVSMTAMSNQSSEPSLKDQAAPTPIRASSSTEDIPLPSSEPVEDAFNPGWRFMAAFASLCFITLMAALDATSLSVALPVNLPMRPIYSTHN